MNPTHKWCPLCSLPEELLMNAKRLCQGCAGNGVASCPHCLCLDCGGTGKIPCPECSGGQMPCPECKGKGSVPGLFGLNKCRRCDQTGLVYHDGCGGVGSTVCMACAGIGNLPDCDVCAGSSESQCSECFGTGFAPSEEVYAVAEEGTLAHLLRQLDIQSVDGAFEPLDNASAIHRIVSFLAFHHWAVTSASSDSEHELHVFERKLHFRVASLSIGHGSSVHIEYRFLDVQRTGAASFKVTYSHQKKAWR